MKSVSSIYLKYAGVIFILVFLIVAYGYRNSQPSPPKDEKLVKSAAARISEPRAKKMTPGASCCKVSFSRAKMLPVKNSQSNITPAP